MAGIINAKMDDRRKAHDGRRVAVADRPFIVTSLEQFPVVTKHTLAN